MHKTSTNLIEIPEYVSHVVPGFSYANASKNLSRAVFSSVHGNYVSVIQATQRIVFTNFDLLRHSNLEKDLGQAFFVESLRLAKQTDPICHIGLKYICETCI